MLSLTITKTIYTQKNKVNRKSSLCHGYGYLHLKVFNTPDYKCKDDHQFTHQTFKSKFDKTTMIIIKSVTSSCLIRFPLLIFSKTRRTEKERDVDLTTFSNTVYHFTPKDRHDKLLSLIKSSSSKRISAGSM